MLKTGITKNKLQFHKRLYSSIFFGILEMAQAQGRKRLYKGKCLKSRQTPHGRFASGERAAGKRPPGGWRACGGRGMIARIRRFWYYVTV
jgi:hypothetical protein